MVKAMGKILVAILVALVLLVGGGWFALTQTGLGSAAAQAVLSSGAAAQTIENALLANEDAIAQRLGVDVSQVEDAVRELDVSSWQAVEAPADAAPAQEYTTTYQGVQVTATLYSDPSYVTVGAGGQEVTLRVPDSAQQYLAQLEASGALSR